MSVKRDAEDMKKVERGRKIRAHLAKTSPPATAKADSKVELGAAKADHKAEPSTQPRLQESLIYPPLQPWERLNRWGRREQFRPMTSREFDQENDRLFMESQQRQDEAHAKKVAAAVEEQKEEQKRIDKQRAHEQRTGMRPYGRDHTCSLEEARRRGYLGSGTGSSNDNEWSSPGNPQGLMGGGLR